MSPLTLLRDLDIKTQDINIKSIQREGIFLWKMPPEKSFIRSPSMKKVTLSLALLTTCGWGALHSSPSAHLVKVYNPDVRSPGNGYFGGTNRWWGRWDNSWQENSRPNTGYYGSDWYYYNPYYYYPDYYDTYYPYPLYPKYDVRTEINQNQTQNTSPGQS